MDNYVGDRKYGAITEKPSAETINRWICEIIRDIPCQDISAHEIKTQRAEKDLRSLVETLGNDGIIIPRIANRLTTEITDHPRFQELILSAILLFAEDGQIEHPLLALSDYEEIFHMKTAFLENTVLQNLLQQRIAVMNEHQQVLASVLEQFVTQTEAVLSFSG